MSKVRTWLRQVLQKSLAEVVNNRGSAQVDAKSVVELFIENSRDDTDGIRPEDMTGFLQTFILAARDTTALSMSWLFYELEKNPRVVRAIRDEMATRLPPEIAADKRAYLTTDHIRSLTYLEATLKELLRLRPAAPTTVKHVLRDTIICGDIPLYKDQLILLNAYALARNPRVWGSDAAEFRPERWIHPASGELIQVSPSKFFTFHAGPRTCIGMGLAMLELRVVTANLLHRFSFDVDPANDGSYITSLTHMMKLPLFAKVHAL